jgi:hypothetical protein
MSVELLYFDGCPNVEGYLPHLRELITAAGRHDHVQLRRISNGADARTERFLGSPSVRVDGRDVDPTAANRTDFGMSCRVYASPDGMTGAPPDEWGPGGTQGRHARPRPLPRDPTGQATASSGDLREVADQRFAVPGVEPDVAELRRRQDAPKAVDLGLICPAVRGR